MDKIYKDRLGAGWILIAALCFTLMNFQVKDAAQRFGLSTAELVFWRMGFSAVFLGAMARFQGLEFKTPHWRAHLSRSISGSVAMLCIFYGITHLPLATGVTLSYTSSIFLAVFSFLVLKERISPYTVMVLILGFIGVAVLLNPSFKSGQELAAMVGLAGGALAGWAYMQVRELSLLGEPGWRVVFYLSLIGMLLAGIWATFEGWHAFNIQALPHLLGVGASALVAQLCMTRAYKVGNKFTVASLSYLTVVFSSLAGMWWLGDKIGWQETLGMGIIVMSGVLSSIPPSWLQRYRLFRQ
ncbi:DMT family transporter [Neisseria weaveri]|uniref:Predicted permease, DMT superfamily n=1 Tax=Neisseria weaveri TaxID=28091 RepID=A0A3S5ACC4_9NEIS|nr:DMT family transporter [Neisseria weaveri]EGV34801.1 membrane protein [Neisseria weaveri ATCC 51223]EGV38035.1 membrane protein [Neisseria weaveri LMG 5135]SAY50734.1 Predicted permease, DMT superfamily [Neisseria weaveri]VEJ52133.1 Predicted permease, DMT superfamily [Neisseria weaveri]